MAGLAAVAAPVHAQLSGSLALASENRYRGVATEDVGPVLRAGVMVDAWSRALAGAYAGVSGTWRTRDAGLAQADALAGWSGRWNAWGPLQALDAGWGWDLGVHRQRDGAGREYDFTEAMAGLLAPAGSVRAWWSPHYFGSAWSSLYLEANASRAIGDRWRVFAHLGRLSYGGGPVDGWRPPTRIDALAGVAWTRDRVELRLSREGLLAGQPWDGIGSDHRAPAWVATASLAF